MAERDAALPVFDDAAVLRALFAASPDTLLLVDVRGTIVLANDAAPALLGYSVDELVGLSVDALVPDGIAPRHAAYRDAYARSPRPRPMGTQTELVAKRRDGSEVMVEIALSPLHAHGLPYVMAAIRDIGAYPRVIQALKRARYAERVAQTGRLAVDTRDPQQLLAQLPRAAAEALGVDSCVVFVLAPSGVEFRVAGGIGLTAGESLGDRVPNRPDTLPGHVLAEGRPTVIDDYASERRFAVPPAYTAGGAASGLAVPLSDRGRTVGALAVRSQRAQRFGDDEVRFLESLANLLAASLQRAQTEEQLNHAQRLESVGQLTGGIAHDFNNLLTVISGNLQVIEELPAVAADPYGRQLVAAAMRAGRRAAELTGKLLAFSRRQVLQPSRVDPAAMLESLADLLRRTLDQRIEIALTAAPGCPPCLADPGQLEAALLSIAINARDAMPEGGTLAFDCRGADATPGVASAVPAESADADLETEGQLAYVAIAVSDTGVGMPEGVKERAFEPFFTTKDAGRGTGLGLSTVYGFATQSRGAVTLASSPGVGTTVTLYLPAWREAGPADEAAGETPATLRAGVRVLLVEDEAEVSAVVQRFLAGFGCLVTACATGEAALELLGTGEGQASGEAPFELLLTDIALGAGIRGTELATRAQKRFPGLGVLLMTGFSGELLEAPADWGLLRKPCTRGELKREVARVAGR